MLYPNVSDEAVEFECEGEDVVVVRGVPHHEGAVWFRGQDPFRRLTRQRTPVPAALKGTDQLINTSIDQSINQSNNS